MMLTLYVDVTVYRICLIC